jgi:hypothetical protein
LATLAEVNAGSLAGLPRARSIIAWRMSWTLNEPYPCPLYRYWQTNVKFVSGFLYMTPPVALKKVLPLRSTTRYAEQAESSGIGRGSVFSVRLPCARQEDT